MKISCEKARHICNKSQYNEASLLEIIKLKFHHFFCKVCLKHSENNARLTKLCNSADLHTMPSDEKEVLKKRLAEKIQ